MVTYLTVKGQIVISSKIRRKPGMKERTRVQVEVGEGAHRIILTPITREYADSVRGKPKGQRAAHIADPLGCEIISGAHEHGTSLLMVTVNAGKIWYTASREVSDTAAERAIVNLNHTGINFVDADWAPARVTAGFKVRHRITYTDFFAATLPGDCKTVLVTGDPDSGGPNERSVSRGTNHTRLNAQGA